MEMKIANAALAYAQALGRSLDGGAPAGDGQAAGTSFADLIAQVTNQTIGAGTASEKATMQAVEQKSNLADIATAVTNAQVTLDTVVAVRDKVIAAYQDIIKMPI
ncbi:MAG TPA: flagellar hook-basal body complex protein FliE [Candidatus Sulfotelmatobacter sp.]|nr:flagellar hook-basal body complex protein FliE [Candidatus Sulfotelmatobacter sp.]